MRAPVQRFLGWFDCDVPTPREGGLYGDILFPEGGPLTYTVVSRLMEVKVAKPEEAVIEVYRLYKREIFESLRWLGLPEDEARDTCQDIFLKYFEWVSDGKQIDNPRAWLRASAKNKAYDFFKSADQRKRSKDSFWRDIGIDNEVDGTHPHEAYEDAEQHQGSDRILQGESNANLYIQECVTRKLKEFGALYPVQEIAINHQFDGYSTSEIGKKIGRTEAATRTFLCEAKKKLKHYLVDCQELLNTETVQ